MLTIYGVYRSRALRALWLAEELSLPFRHVPIIQAYRLKGETPNAPLNTRSAEFMAINPNGHIPTIDDDGLVLHESMAINLHIARKAGGPLAPADASEDALMTMWSFWGVTEIEQHALTIQTHAGKDQAMVEKAVSALRRPFSVLRDALADTGHIIGARFTVADLNVAEVVRYATAANALFDEAPQVKTWLDACHARPAFKAVWRKREAEAL